MLLPHLHPLRLLKQNSPVPKNACRYSSSFVRGMFELYGSRSCLLYIQPPVKLNISEESISACGCDPSTDVLPKPCFLSGGQVRATLPPNSSEADRKVFSTGISESTRHDTCIPISCGLNIVFVHEASLRDFDRSTFLEASLFCRNRQTVIVPRQSRGDYL